MKELKRLNNVERAKLLFELFPSEIPAVVDYIAAMCDTILEDEQQNRQSWQIGLLSFDFWLSLIKEAKRVIKKNGSRLHKNSKVFSDQLFDGYLACYTGHCLCVYVTDQKHPNEKFAAMVNVLFIHYSTEF